MTGYEKLIAGLGDKCRGQREEGDYQGPGGLVYCGKCHTPKQRRGIPGDPGRVIWCLCRCESRRRQEERETMEQENLARQRQKRRRENIPNLLLRDFRFEGALETEVIKRCRRYAESLCRGEAGNLGLLLWGGVGSGKTFAAACIAGFAEEQGVSTRVTSLPRINGASLEERREFLDKLSACGLLVLDDLGTERDTATANETTFQVVNTRYESKKPMIITTNLTPEQLHSPQTQHQARIFDRVLEVCVPVFCGTDSMRERAGRENMERMKGILGAG